MPVIQQIQVPLLSVNDNILTISEVTMENGSAVKKGDLLLVFESSKTTYDVFAEEDGYVQYHCIEGNDYEINEIVAIIYSTADEVQLPLSGIENNASSAVPGGVPTYSNWDGVTVFSKTALAFMKDKQLSKDHFIGKDFINKEDIEMYLGLKVKPAAALSHEPPKRLSGLAASFLPESDLVSVEKITKSKRKEIEYLRDVQSTGLTSTVNTFIDTEGIFLSINQSLRYLKNTLLPFIVYESSRLLKKYPVFNSYFENDQINFYKEVNIGFAIDIDKGLKVVKIPLARESSISYLEDQILLLSEKYLDDNLSIDDLNNITFTITDLSAEGIFSFRPLINRMNSAILGISSIDEKLQRCILSLTFDHRVTEGKTASKYLSELKQRLESYRMNFDSHRAENTTCYKCLKSMKDDLSDIGFIKCISPQGTEALICQSCLKGF